MCVLTVLCLLPLQGLSFPAAQYLHAFPCPKYKQKACGLEGQVLDIRIPAVNSLSKSLLFIP